MNKSTDELKTMFDSSHALAGAKPMHDREQLRRRLLQMILKSESERRAAQLPPTRGSKRLRADAGAKLNVFDPENLMDREIAADATPPKRA